MTQEEKKLLLKDLSARLFYRPKVKVLSFWNEDKEVEEDIVDSVYCVMPDGYINTEMIDSDISLDNIVLYLRPMSSMTEEEKFEYDRILSIEHEGYLLIEEVPDIIDFYNSKHLDYRGLIPMGLALPASEDMYNIKYND